MIEALTGSTLKRWEETPEDFREQRALVDHAQKRQNEHTIDRFRLELAATVRRIPNRFVNRRKWRNQIQEQVRTLETTVSPQRRSRLDYFLSLGYGEATDTFIQQVHTFDDSLNVYAIFQAIRNVWIMNSIQILYGVKVELTPSIFAYSIMYPYSDNYLDDPVVTREEKVEFSQRFRQWLLGEKVPPHNEREERLCQLVRMVEWEFDRGQFPLVYESLLAIHAAQEKSLMQQGGRDGEILAISVEKGGTSVLADAYLVRGNLEWEEAQYLFDYGVFLQLIDDLQDVSEDQMVGHHTIFTHQESHGEMDALVNRLRNFIADFSRNTKCFPSEQAEELKRVISDSSLLMLEEAIAQHGDRFSPSYLAGLEGTAPVHYPYLASLREEILTSFTAQEMGKVFRLFASR